MDTFATPGTPMSRGRIFHLASTDMSTGETVLEDSPTMATGLADASGWIMIGGLPTLGRACAWVIRSCTICRAAYRLVPGWNVRSIADSPGIEEEWIRSSHGTPLSRSCSSGTV